MFSGYKMVRGIFWPRTFYTPKTIVCIVWGRIVWSVVYSVLLHRENLLRVAFFCWPYGYRLYAWTVRYVEDKNCQALLLSAGTCMAVTLSR